MAKARTVWRCQNCGASAPRWMGRCNDCGEFGTFVEEIEQPAGVAGQAARASVQPLGLDAVGAMEARRTTRLKEATRLGMRRVLGHAPTSLDAADAGGLVRVSTAADALDLL